MGHWRLSRYRSTLDYIFVPNCLLGNTISCKTFDMQIENTSDHLPVTLELNYPTSSLDIIADDFTSDLESNPKIDWSKFSQEEISEKYITPLVNQLENINITECLDSNDSAETITNLLLQNSVSLANILVHSCSSKQIKRIKVLSDSLRKLR